MRAAPQYPPAGLTRLHANLPSGLRRALEKSQFSKPGRVLASVQQALEARWAKAPAAEPVAPLGVSGASDLLPASARTVLRHEYEHWLHTGLGLGGVDLAQLQPDFEGEVFRLRDRATGQLYLLRPQGDLADLGAPSEEVPGEAGRWLCEAFRFCQALAEPLSELPTELPSEPTPGFAAQNAAASDCEQTARPANEADGDEVERVMPLEWTWDWPLEEPDVCALTPASAGEQVEEVQDTVEPFPVRVLGLVSRRGAHRSVGRRTDRTWPRLRPLKFGWSVLLRRVRRIWRRRPLLPPTALPDASSVDGYGLMILKTWQAAGLRLVPERRRPSGGRG